MDKSALQLSLDNLGITEETLQDFKRVLKMPYGMMLVIGPTGSGKTITLYSTLEHINRPDINIITIEIPLNTI